MSFSDSTPPSSAPKLGQGQQSEFLSVPVKHLYPEGLQKKPFVIRVEPPFPSQIHLTLTTHSHTSNVLVPNCVPWATCPVFSPALLSVEYQNAFLAFSHGQAPCNGLNPVPLTPKVI